jgi:hypothetical protein
MTLNNTGPIFDPETHYRITVQGRIDMEWLQRFDSSAEISADEVEPIEDSTLLNVHTDQAGIVGLVRRLHGLGMTILQLQIVSIEGKASEVEEQVIVRERNGSP